MSLISLFGGRLDPRPVINAYGRSLAAALVRAGGVWALILMITTQALAQNRETVFAVGENNTFYQFSSLFPDSIERQFPLVGLADGESIVAIDFRPCLCGLYGISNRGALYEINPNNGVVQLRTTMQPLVLNSTSFDMDYDPHRDGLRVITNLGQNIRLYDLDEGTILNDSGSLVLSYDAASPNQADRDAATAGTTPSIVAIAYANNTEASDYSVLYGIDARTNSLVTIGSDDTLPYNGGLARYWNANTGKVRTVGALIRSTDNTAIDATRVSSFDIGFPGYGQALAVFTEGNTSRIYGLTLEGAGAGIAVPIGAVSTPERIRSIAIGLAGDVEFDVPSISVLENAGSVAVTVSRVGGTAGNPSVEVYTDGLTAGANTDYNSLNTVINFAKGEFSKQLIIPILDDSSYSGNRSFEIKLRNPKGGAVLGAQTSLLVTIQEDEIVPQGYDLQVGWPKKLSYKGFAALKGKGIKLPVTCSAACTATASILVPESTASAMKIASAKGGVIAQQSLPIASQTKGLLSLRANRKARKYYAKNRKAQRVTTRVQAVFANGPTLVQSRSLKLK